MSSLREHIERSERRPIRGFEPENYVPAPEPPAPVENSGIGQSRTDLDGATILPAEGAYAANAGEWAARWNARPEWQREQWVHHHNENALRQLACLNADHEGRIEYLQKEVERLTRLLADNHIAYLGAIGVRLSDLAA